MKIFKPLLTALIVVLLPAITVSQVQANNAEEKKVEKFRKREPVVDTFTRIDEGEGETDALVVYGHPLYFAYKGVFDSAHKKYDMDKFHVFIVTINSSKKDISSFKVESKIFLRTEEGLEYPAVQQWIPLSESPTKRTGVVRFFQIDANKNKLMKDEAKSFEIVIKDLGGIPERVFKWKIPIEF